MKFEGKETTHFETINITLNGSGAITNNDITYEIINDGKVAIMCVMDLKKCNSLFNLSSSINTFQIPVPKQMLLSRRKNVILHSTMSEGIEYVSPADMNEDIASSFGKYANSNQDKVRSSLKSCM